MKKWILTVAFLLSLCTIDCGREELGYKRKKPRPPIEEPPPPPTDTTTPPATTGYLYLPLSAPLNLSGQSNIVIENKRFQNVSGRGLTITNSSNIIIRNCFFNISQEEAISIENSSNITVINCLFAYNAGSVYALNSSGIKVNNNQFINTRQRTTGGRGQFVQFNSVTGAGNEVINNKGENWLEESNPEDLISMFNSSGTESSWIQINNNMFRGGGPSTSGGGIMLGDYGGNYQIADGNTLLDPGQYGMAASGGNHLKIINNKIFARQQSFTNNPLYVANYSGKPCGTDITVNSNRVNWTDKNSNKNNGWNSGDCGAINWQSPTTITEIELAVPIHLITFVTPEELLKIRQKQL